MRPQSVLVVVASAQLFATTAAAQLNATPTPFASMVSAPAPSSPAAPASVRTAFRISCDPLRPAAICNRDVADSAPVRLDYWAMQGNQPVQGVLVYASGTGGDVAPGVMATDSTGHVAIQWHGTIKNNAPVLIYLIATKDGIVSTRVDTLTSHVQPTTLTLEPAEQRSFRWVAGAYIPDSITVVLRGFQGSDQAVIDRCEEQRVVFRRTLNDAKPDTIQARYAAAPNERSGYECQAAIRWKLADVSGDQVLRAELVGARTTAPANSTQRPYADIHAVAQAPARFLVGVADQFRSLARLPNGAKSDIGRPVQPIIGLDFSLPSAMFRSETVGAILDRVRLVAATSAQDLGADIYGGVEIAPLFEGSEILNVPMQVTVGSRIISRQRSGHLYVALTYDAGDVIATVLKTLRP